VSTPDERPDQHRQQHPEQLQRPEPPRRVRVNRTPRYGVFLVGGALVGAVVALGLTFSEPATEYGYASTLGYLVVALGLLGALVGGLAAVVAGAVLERRQRRQEGAGGRPEEQRPQGRPRG
jgi:hypothetical protein